MTKHFERQIERLNELLLILGGMVEKSVDDAILAIESRDVELARKVIEGRLFYCTTAGGFTAHRIPLNDYTRQQGLEVLAVIDRAIEEGFLPAAPSDRACKWCDFRPICGPREEERVSRKSVDRLADLLALRAIR